MRKKTKKPLTPEETESQMLKDYFGLIAPSVINFKVNRDYFVVGNTYRSVWAVRGYPTKVAADASGVALLSKIGEKDGITVKIYTKKLSEYEQQQILNNATKTNKYKRKDHKVTTSMVAEENIQDIKNLIVRSHQRKEHFIYCAVFIEIIADSLENLKTKQSNLKNALSHKNILVDFLHLQQKQGFLSVMPNGHNMFGTQFERALPSSSVANLFPFSYSGKTDPNGFYLGRDENGSNVMVDFDLRGQTKTNGHILILGNSGEGKTYLMFNIMINLRIAGKKIFILDPENDYRKMVRRLGGTDLDMTSAEYCINPLEPRLLSTGADEDIEEDENLPTPEAFKKGTILTQHIAYLRDFFRIYRNFKENELDVIEIMLEETYKRAHISDSTDFSKLKPQDYPILSDFYKVITDKLVSYKEDYEESIGLKHPILYTEELLQKVGLGLRSICVGSSSRYFNNFTNIPSSDFINFAVNGLLQTNENLKNAMFLNIFSYMSHKFLTEGDCELIVDEFHEFVKNKLVIQYISSYMKRGRKRNSAVTIGSQNPEDLLHPEVISYTKPLLSIPTHSFLFHPGLSCNPKEYKNVLNMQSHEFDLISAPNQGYCLYRCGTERYHLHVMTSAYRHNLIISCKAKQTA